MCKKKLISIVLVVLAIFTMTACSTESATNTGSTETKTHPCVKCGRQTTYYYRLGLNELERLGVNPEKCEKTNNSYFYGGYFCDNCVVRHVVSSPFT